MPNELIEAMARAMCSHENPGVFYECKICRNARWEYNPETNEDVVIDLPEGCLGAGYLPLATAALAAITERYVLCEREAVASVWDTAKQGMIPLYREADIQTDCPSCHGLNTSCPDGCRRDPVTGELNGTRLDREADHG